MVWMEKTVPPTKLFCSTILVPLAAADFEVTYLQTIKTSSWTQPCILDLLYATYYRLQLFPTWCAGVKSYLFTSYHFRQCWMVPVWRKLNVCEEASGWLKKVWPRLQTQGISTRESPGHVSGTASENFCLYIQHELFSLTNASYKSIVIVQLCSKICHIRLSAKCYLLLSCFATCL